MQKKLDVKFFYIGQGVYVTRKGRGYLPGPIRLLRTYLPGPLRPLRTYLPGPLRLSRQEYFGKEQLMCSKLRQWWIDRAP